MLSKKNFCASSEAHDEEINSLILSLALDEFLWARNPKVIPSTARSNEKVQSKISARSIVLIL